MLDERQLDEPLEVAIRKVRSDPANRGVRILVIGSEDPEDSGTHQVLLPQPSRRPPPRTEDGGGAVDDAIQRTGARWLIAEEIHAHWLGESSQMIEELRRQFADDDMEALGRNLRRLAELHEWMDATSQEYLYQASKANLGMEKVRTAELLRDAARSSHLTNPRVDIGLPSIGGSPRATVRTADLRTAFELAFACLAHRIHDRGTIRVEIEEGSFFLHHRLHAAAIGEERQLRSDPDHLRRKLEHLVNDVHGGRIFPGTDKRATGLVIALPRRGMENLVS